MSNLVGKVHVGVEVDSTDFPAKLAAALSGVEADVDFDRSHMARQAQKFRTQFEAALKNVMRKPLTVGGVKVGVDFDAAHLAAQALKFRRQLHAALKAATQGMGLVVSVDVDLDPGGSAAQAAAGKGFWGQFMDGSWFKRLRRGLRRAGSGGFFDVFTSSLSYALQGVKWFLDANGYLFGVLGNLGQRLVDVSGKLGRFGKVLAPLGKAMGALGKAGQSLFSNPWTAAVAVVGVLATLGKAVSILSPLLNAAAGVAATFASALGNTAAAGLVLVPVLVSLAAGAGAFLYVGGAAAKSLGALFSAMSSGDPKKMEEYRKSLEGLGPAARSAVRAFEPLLSDLEELRRQAQDRMFDGMADSVSTFAPVLDTVKGSLGDISEAVGDVIDRFLELGNNAVFVESLGALLSSTSVIVGNIGAGLVNLFAGFTNFFAAVAPVAELFSQSVRSVGDSFLTWTASEENRQKVTDFFYGAYEVARLVVGILWELGGVLVTVFTDSQGPILETDGILQGIKRKLEDVKAWLDKPENKDKLKEWFRQAAQFASSVWQAISYIAREFQRLNTPENREAMLRVIGFLGQMAGAALRLAGYLGQVFDLLMSIIKYQPAALIGRTLGAVGNALRGSQPQAFAAGGLVSAPTRALVGEAGPELIVPLRRPLGLVDPSVRDVAALVRGLPGRPPPTRQVNVVQHIYPNQADPQAVAVAVMNRYAVAVGG